MAELKTKAVFDFETKSSFSFDVTVTDKAGLQLKHIFTLKVEDANDPPNVSFQSTIKTVLSLVFVFVFWGLF